jgi:DNA repair exonuclease SbcCD ATPase subunit
MADVRVDVELTTSLKGVQTELAKVLRPIEQLLQKLSGNATLDLQLTKQGAGLVSKQLEEFASKAGIDPKEAKKLGEAFRVFVADIDRYLRSVRRGELEEAGRRLDSAMKSLQTFTEGIAAWDEKLKGVALPALRLVTKRGSKAAIDPNKIVKAVEAIEADLGRFFTDRAKKEAQELRKHLYLQLQSIKHDASEGRLEEAKQTLEDLYKELKTSGALPDPRTLKDIQKVLRDLRKQVNDLVARTADEVQRLAKEYLVSSALPKLAPGVDPDALFRAYSYLGGSRQALLDAFYSALIKQDPFGNMAVGQTAKGLQKTVSWLVGNIEQEMVLGLMSSEYGRNLIAAKGQQAFLEQLAAAYGLLSSQLLYAKPEELRRTADMFLKDAKAAKAKFNIALEDVRGIGIALKAVADHLQTYSVMEKLALHTYSNLLNERAEGNPLTGAYRYGRQQALDARHEDYLRAFLPGLYKRYQQLRDQGDPRALTFRADVVSRLGTSIDAVHGLLLNSLANFVSGIGIGVFFGTVYAIAQYVQQMQALNKQLLAYKKILEMRGEQSMAESVSVLRDRLLELAKASGVAVEEVARLFGTVARNGMSTDGMERLLAVVGRLNEVFGIPFDALRKDIAETLLQHRQYFLGPDTISRVLEYGGPQADKALNVFNELLKMTNSAAFSFDELAKAVRYYLDTGKPVKDSFYEIAKAVEYGGTVAEEMARKLHQMAQETVDFGQILTRGDEYQDNLQRLQKQLGLTISALGHDIMTGFGIGEASTYMTTLQAMLTGFLALVKGIQDLINAVLNLKVIGPMLQVALAVLTGTGITVLVVSMFRLLGIFAARVMESVVATTAILRSANLTTGLATATNLLVALRGNLVKFFTSLGAVIATAGAGAMNLLRTGGLAALAGGTLAAVRGGIGAALAGGAALLSAIPGIGWMALGATALVGAGVYIASKNAQRRKEETNKVLESSQQTIPAIGRAEQSGSVIKLYTPDNTTGTPTYTIDLEKLRSKDATDKLVAYMLGRLQGADKLVYEHVVNLMRALDIRDKTSLEQYRKQLSDEMIRLAQAYAKADEKGKQAIQQQLLNLTVIAKVVNAAGDAYVEAIQKASGVMQQTETRSALDAQYQAKLNEYATQIAKMTDREKIEFQKKIALEIIKATAGDVQGKSLFAVDIAQTVLSQTLENLQRELSERLLSAESLPTETARNAAKRAAYSWYISQLQAEKSKLVSFFRKAGLDPNLGTRLYNLLEVKTREAQAQLGQVTRQMQDFQRSLADAGSQAEQQLNNVMKEAFYGPTSTPSLTAKLLATAESILRTTANDAPEKAAVVARQVNAYLAKNLAVAQQYDREVQTMLNEFSMAKRVSDPEKRFQNLKLVVQKYLSLYPKKLREMPGLALQIADQLETALFKDGGMLSAINSLADSTSKELKNIAERVQQKDYGPFADLGRVLEGLTKGLETLAKVSIMTADFKDLTAKYNKLLGDVRLTQVKDLDKAIATSKATLEEYRKLLPKLSAKDKEYMAMLDAHVKNLTEIKNLMVELTNIENRLANTGLSNEERKRFIADKVKIQGRLDTLRADAEKRGQELAIASAQLTDTLTDYASSLKDAIAALLGSITSTLDDITKKIEEQRKQLDRTVKTYLQRGKRVSPAEEVEQGFKEILEFFEERRDFVEQFRKALSNIEGLLNSGKIAELEKVLDALVSGKALPKNASAEMKEMYDAFRKYFPVTINGKTYTAKDFLNDLRTSKDAALKFISDVRAELDALASDVNRGEQAVTSHYQALRRAAELREKVQHLEESKNRLIEILAATDFIDVYRGQVDDILNQAKNLEDQLNALKAEYPELETSDIEKSLSEIKQIIVEYFSMAVDDVVNRLPQLSEILNPTDVDVSQITKALDLLDQLDQVLRTTDDPKTEAKLKKLRERLVNDLVQLAKSGGDFVLRLIETALGPEMFAKLRAEITFKEFGDRLAAINKLLDFKVESLGDVSEADENIRRAREEIEKHKKELAAMRESKLYYEDQLLTYEQSLADLENRIEAINRDVRNREYQLLQQMDAELLNSAKEAVESVNKLAKKLLLAGVDINEILNLYSDGIEGILNLPFSTSEAKAEAANIVQNLVEGLVFLLSEGIPEAVEALKAIFGDLMEFLASIEGFGNVKSTDVRLRIRNAIIAKLADRGFGIDETQAETIANVIISKATEDVENAYEEAAKALRELGFGDIVLSIRQGDFSKLQEYAPKINKAGELLSKLLNLAATAAMFGKELDDKVKDEFLRFATENISSIENLPSILQELVDQGKLSELAVTDWLEQLINTLQFVRGLLLGLAKTLELSEQQVAALQTQLLDAERKLQDDLVKRRAAALHMYLRGDLTSDEFNRRLRGKEVLLGAKSLTEFAQLTEGLVQMFAKLERTPGLSEAAKRSRLISRLSTAALLDDKSLVKLVAPDMSEKELQDFFNRADYKERLEALRAAIKRAINDLQEEAERELEQMIDGLVNSLRDALANLFTSIFTIPVQMLRAWREQQKQLQEMRFELRLAASDVEYWQQKYDEAVKTYGVLSEEARKYAEKVAEAKRAHEELSERIKETERNAKSLFSYLLDAIAQFLEALAQAVMQQAAFRAATWLIDTAMGAAFGGGGTVSPASTGTLAPQSVSGGEAKRLSAQSAGVQPQGQTAAAASVPTGSAVVSGIINVGSAVATRALSGTISSLGIAGPIAGLLAGLVVSVVADWVADIADRAFNSKYYTFAYGTKGRFDDMPSPVRLQQPVNVNVQVQAELDKNKIAKETTDRLVKELIHAGV